MRAIIEVSVSQAMAAQIAISDTLQSEFYQTASNVWNSTTDYDDDDELDELVDNAKFALDNAGIDNYTIFFEEDE